MRVIDFFCGGGGFSEGFRQAGFDVIWAIDNWKIAVDTHKENHPHATALQDNVIRIANLPDDEFHSIVPDSEVIIGSPPCTSFSNSNKSGNGDKTLGLELIKAYLKIVARKKFKTDSILKYWILENVPKVEPYIKDAYTAEELGISGDHVLMVKNNNCGEYNAKYFGVPSNRIRYFCGDFPVPKRTINTDNKLIPLKKILNALGAPKAKLHTQITDPIYGIRLNGEDVTDHHYIQQLSEFERTKIIRLKQDKGYMGKMSVPENPEKPARTIMATMSFTSRECFVLGSIDKLRAPSIREVATLMSFPIDYRFYGTSLGTKYRLIGNAVPPKMSFAFAKVIKIAEGLDVPTAYTPIAHPHTIDFINLNLDEISIKEEKSKKETARFKYHIPYFKFDTYRVELTNAHSDFDTLNFKWDAEIHYNQGKDRAKSYTPNVELMTISKSDAKRAHRFLSQLRNKVTTYDQFQRIHCMTMQEIESQGLLGPFELLNALKNYLDTEFKFGDTELEYTKLAEEPFQIPKPIAIGYYILYHFTKLMEK